MTNKQKLELRLSELRSRLNEISGLAGAAFTDEIRTESETLAVEFRDTESRWRSATIADSGNNGDGEVRRVEDDDSESTEIRQLSEKVELRRYLDVAAQRGTLDGAESELNAALNIRSAGVSVPWAALVPNRRRVERVESRVDASTALPASGPQTIERDFVGRVFAGGGADFLGVRFDSVPVGEASHFVLTAGASGVHKSEGAAQDAVEATIEGRVLEPHRLTAAYSFRVEDLARSMNLEESLRMDLAGALREAMDSAVLNGAVDGPAGLLNTLAAPDDPTDEIVYAGIITEAAKGVDGRYAKNLLQIRMLLGSETYQKIAGSFNSDGTMTGSDYLIQRSGGLAASALIPDAASDIQEGVLARMEAPGNAVAAVWEQGVSLTIRDEFTRANRGEVRLQAIGLWDFAILRSDGFESLKFLLA